MLEILKTFKFPYTLYNFFKKHQLEHNIPLFNKYGLKKSYYSSVSSADFRSIESPKNIYDAQDSRSAMPSNPAFEALDNQLKNELLPWSEKGYAILKGFFSAEEIDAVNQEIQSLVDTKQVKFKYRTKIMFAIDKSKLLFDFGTNKKLLSVLDLLLGKKVELFQSINFFVGSQQRSHSDSIHMTTFPYGNMIAVWVALEDITAESGPLHYYPGSHTMPYIMNHDYNNVGTETRLGKKTYSDYEDHLERIIKAKGLKKEVFVAKKGDVFIWHANLIHGGEKVIDPKSTRKSMVFHFYTTDAFCFHEITQRPSLKHRITFADYS